MSPALFAGARAALAPDVSVGHLLLQMVIALLIVVGAIWALGKLATRSRRARRAPKEPTGLQVLSRQSVGKGKSVAVVEIGSQRFLVGMTGSALTALGELEGEKSATGEGEIAAPPDRVVAAVLPEKRSMIAALRDATVRR